MGSVTIELELPEDLDSFRLPGALDERLANLLDRQDQAGPLKDAEQREAHALCEIVDMLALLKLRAERHRLASNRKNK